MTRPAGGRCDESDAAELDRLLRHHVALARPQRLLLVGSDMLRIATGRPLADVRGKLLDLNHDGGKVEAVAIAHPAMLLARPELQPAQVEGRHADRLLRRRRRRPRPGRPLVETGAVVVGADGPGARLPRVPRA